MVPIVVRPLGGCLSRHHQTCWKSNPSKKSSKGDCHTHTHTHTAHSHHTLPSGEHPQHHIPPRPRSLAPLHCTPFSPTSNLPKAETTTRTAAPLPHTNIACAAVLPPRPRRPMPSKTSASTDFPVLVNPIRAPMGTRQRSTKRSRTTPSCPRASARTRLSSPVWPKTAAPPLAHATARARSATNWLLFKSRGKFLRLPLRRRTFHRRHRRRRRCRCRRGAFSSTGQAIRVQRPVFTVARRVATAA